MARPGYLKLWRSILDKPIWKQSSAEQKELYAEYLKLNQGAANSVRLQAQTVEDALVEITVRKSTAGRDAGYYA